MKTKDSSNRSGKSSIVVAVVVVVVVVDVVVVAVVYTSLSYLCCYVWLYIHALCSIVSVLSCMRDCWFCCSGLTIVYYSLYKHYNKQILLLLLVIEFAVVVPVLVVVVVVVVLVVVVVVVAAVRGWIIIDNQALVSTLCVVSATE